MKSKGDRKSRTVEILVDGLKSPASVLAPLAPTRDMSFDQISLMFTQMQQMMQQLQKQNEQMHMTLQLLIQQQFGKSSEQLKQNPDWETLPLFAPEMLPQSAGEDDSPNQQSIDGYRKKSVGRKPLAGASHVVNLVNDVEASVLDDYRSRGYSVRPMPSTHTSYFQRINAVILVEVENRKYTVKCKDEELVLSAQCSRRFLPKTKVGELLLAEIAYQKYGLHVPHNRLSKALGLDGIDISRQDMSNYGLAILERIKAAEESFRAKVLAQAALYMDETTTKKQGSEKTKNYMWAVCNEHLAWYRYFDGRGGGPPLSMFTDYTGWVMADGYGAYDSYLGKAHRCVCLAHVARRFKDCEKITKDHNLAGPAIAWIARLYKIDSQLRARLVAGEMSKEAFIEERKALSMPILNDFHAWLENAALTTSLINLVQKRAVSYALNQWDKVLLSFENAELKIDNNDCEQSIRVYIQGRKNWVNHGSNDGADASCLLYSLIETAKRQGLNPRNYLAYLFMQAAKYDNLELTGEQIEPLMPWNVKAEDLQLVTDEMNRLSQAMRPIENN
ncbi:IS66 family transposase [uncultured Sphaerochaeta sp.]|uniref:IS66 family transposase n=1 Tax=uncultured Sphaerochaeta sp. TaxID=886478 RepID=UPI002A0A4AEC|nr:IS66 family transposase [uncultured Sphaerochaeta sp.]